MTFTPTNASMQKIHHHDGLINYSNSQVDEILKDLKKIEHSLSTDQDMSQVLDAIVEVEDKITQTVKMLKRSLKGESDIGHVKSIEQALVRLNESYHHAIDKIKASDIKTRTKEVAKVLYGIEDIKERATKKLEILQNKASFEANNFPRFDRILNENKRSVLSESFGRIISIVHLKNEAIGSHEYNFLKLLLDKPEMLGIDTITKKHPEEFKAYVKGLLEEIEATAERRKNLLTNLLEEIKAEQPLTKGENLKYTIQYRQIMNNPSEIPLAKFIYENVKEKNPNFPNDSEVILELNELIHNLDTAEIPYNKSTLEYKLDGLKKIQAEAKKNAKNVDEGETLISGAGPGGLMFGLIASIQGKNFTIVESRKENDSMCRNNILALGKDDQALPMLDSENKTGKFIEADLKLLDFFGVTDRLISEGLSTYEKPTKRAVPFTAKIGDLQRAMLENLKDVDNNKTPVIYGTKIESIKPGEKGKPAKVKLSTEPKERTPSVVYVMEGYRANTRDLLGIDIVKESKAALMGVAFFEMNKAEKLQANLVQNYKKLTNTIRAIPNTINFLYKMLSSSEISDNAERVFTSLGRAELLLRNPDSDYFYFTLAGEEIDTIKEYKTELAHAQKSRERWADKVETYLKENSATLSIGPAAEAFAEAKNALMKNKRREWYKDQGKTAKLFDNIRSISSALSKHSSTISQENLKNLNSLINDFEVAVEETEKLEKEYHKIKEEFSKKITKPGRRTMDLLLYEKTRHTSYSESELSASQVQKAETNYRRMGSTHFYVGGDAESATDPVSGAGFRTTILRTLIASTAFDHPKLKGNLFSQSAFEWASNRTATSMREEGLSSRRAYVTGTERLERYLDMGEEANALSPDQCRFLLNIEGKYKSIQEVKNGSLELSPSDISLLSRIQSQLTERYKSADNKLVNDGALLDIGGLTSNEKEVFLMAWNSIKDGSNIHKDPQFDLKTFKNAASKLAVAKFDRAKINPKDEIYYPEAWYVTLMVQIEQFKQQ